MRVRAKGGRGRLACQDGCGADAVQKRALCASRLCQNLSGILRTGQCGASLESGTHTRKEREEELKQGVGRTRREPPRVDNQ